METNNKICKSKRNLSLQNNVVIFKKKPQVTVSFLLQSYVLIVSYLLITKPISIFPFCYTSLVHYFKDF